MARIEVLSGKTAGTIVSLDPEQPNPVGTSRGSTVRLVARTVFYRHAVIECRAGVWTVVDERSLTGTTVNGERLERQGSRALSHGDKIDFGEVEVRFLCDDEAPAERVAAAAPPPADETERLRARVANLELELRHLQDELGRAAYVLRDLDEQRLHARIEELEGQLARAHERMEDLGARLRLAAAPPLDDEEAVARLEARLADAERARAAQEREHQAREAALREELARTRAELKAREAQLDALDLEAGELRAELESLL